VYRTKEPGKLVRVKAVAPLQATVYECEKLSCNLCNEVYTAAAPPEVGTETGDVDTVLSECLLHARKKCSKPVGVSSSKERHAFARAISM
jgi:hypothetical protein